MGEGLERRSIRVTDRPPGGSAGGAKHEGLKRKENLVKARDSSDASARRGAARDLRNRNDAFRPRETPKTRPEKPAHRNEAFGSREIRQRENTATRDQANIRKDAFYRREDKNKEIEENQRKGNIDETERTFGAKREKPIADKLAMEGHNVKALRETGQGRQPDALVNGIKTEFKKLEPGANSNTVKGSINDSVRRGGQARDIVIDARSSKLSEAEARRGLDRSRAITRGKLDSARIIGDGYDIQSNDFR